MPGVSSVGLFVVSVTAASFLFSFFECGGDDEVGEPSPFWWHAPSCLDPDEIPEEALDCNALCQGLDSCGMIIDMHYDVESGAFHGCLWAETNCEWLLEESAWYQSWPPQ
jgi:hypothetical protein